MAENYSGGYKQTNKQTKTLIIEHRPKCMMAVISVGLYVCLFVCLFYSRLSNFSAIRRLSPLPVTKLQI